MHSVRADTHQQLLMTAHESLLHTLSHATAHTAPCAPSAPAQVWDLSSRKVIRSYEGHGGGVNTVLFHPDGTCIASGSTDGSLKVRPARPVRREAFRAKAL